MDHPLVEWLATLPSSLKVRGQEGKYLLKKAMEPHLPRRDSVPAEDGFRGAAGALVPRSAAQRVRDARAGRRLASTGWFKRRYSAAACVDAHQSGAPRLQRAAVDAADVRGLPAQRTVPRIARAGHRHEIVAAVDRTRRTPRWTAMSLRILHVLDHSLPLHSGYTFRTLAILREQRARGWETLQLTSAQAGGLQGDARRRSTAGRSIAATRAAGVRAPVASHWTHDARAARLAEVIRELEPDILHAHSPVLNALPALWVGRRRDLPVVYEMRASWEDAAVDHGTTTEGSLRYRLSRALETFARARSRPVTTICEGLRGDIVARGIPEDASP